MCCFSGPVKSVSATNIFARMGEAGRQFVVYSMTVDMAKPLAMVLPIPIKKGSDEKSVRFINLEEYKNFFGDLEAGFPRPITKSLSLGDENLPVAASTRVLEVVQVGNFEASFVPAVNDFSRLDERFRMPADLFAKMPDYQNFGFAVFKLKPGAQTVHPMAFEFPTSLGERVFFPTVHIHDGEVHPRAEFDHVLYCQPNGLSHLKLSRWVESPQTASQFMDTKKSAGLILADEHCYKMGMHGLLTNKDTVLEVLKNS
jgi:hypothetical protein